MPDDLREQVHAEIWMADNGPVPIPTHRLAAIEEAVLAVFAERERLLRARMVAACEALEAEHAYGFPELREAIEQAFDA